MVALEQSKSGPRELFSISQIEKAFGPGYVEPGSEGCHRAWGFRYLAGLREPEISYDEAQKLPAETEAERRYRGGALARTWGKHAETFIEAYLRGEQLDPGNDTVRRLIPGFGLLPEPRALLEYRFQAPVKVKTDPNELDGWNQNWPSLAIPKDPISWQGFKDFTGWVALPDRRALRFLIDFKTTTPKVDNGKNRELRRPLGSWAYMKQPGDIVRDWQFNLYQLEEIQTYGSPAAARWVYWASPEKDPRYPHRPEARATDVPAADPAQIVKVVEQLDQHARTLRSYIRQYRAKSLTVLQMPANTEACNAFGGCPYRRDLGGQCDGSGATLTIGKVADGASASSMFDPSKYLFKP